MFPEVEKGSKGQYPQEHVSDDREDHRTAEQESVGKYLFHKRVCKEIRGNKGGASESAKDSKGKQKQERQ